MVFFVNIIDGKRDTHILAGTVSLPAVVIDRQHGLLREDRLMHRVITAVVGVQQALIEVCQPDDVTGQDADLAKSHRFLPRMALKVWIKASLLVSVPSLIQITRPPQFFRMTMVFPRRRTSYWSISAIRSSGRQCSAVIMARISSTARSTVSLMTK